MYKDPYYAKKWLESAEAALKDQNKKELDSLLWQGISDLPDEMVERVDNTRGLIAEKLLQIGPNESELSHILDRVPVYANQAAEVALSQNADIRVLKDILSSKGKIEEGIKKEAEKRIMQKFDKVWADDISDLLRYGSDELKSEITKAIFSPEFETKKLYRMYQSMSLYYYKQDKPDEGLTLTKKIKEELSGRGLSVYLGFDSEKISRPFTATTKR